MSQIEKPEVWLQGPLPGIPGLLQPVAHALLQAREEVQMALAEFPEALLWEKPAGAASVGFHLQHLTGVLDRLFTYAREESLSAFQLETLQQEGRPGKENLTLPQLLLAFENQVDLALDQLKQTNPKSLLEVRTVGRKQIPSTHLGLLFHAAEHTMRHLGQLLVTIRVVQAS